METGFVRIVPIVVASSVDERLLAEVDVRLVADVRSLRLREGRLRGLEVGQGDDVLTVQLLLARERRPRHHQVGRGRRGVRNVLQVLLVQDRRVDLHDQVARLDEVADVDRHRHHLAGRRLRLHLDDVDRLDDARGLRRHNDVAALDGGGLDRHRLRGGRRAADGGDECEVQDIAVHSKLRMETRLRCGMQKRNARCGRAT
jgi:hypothetical protein